jgi:hypothetical protein
MYQQSMSVKQQLCSCDSSVTLLTVSYAWKHCSEWVTARLGAYLPSASMLRQSEAGGTCAFCVIVSFPSCLYAAAGGERA